MDMKLDSSRPVSDVDQAKAFYSEQLGFVVDVDVRPGRGVRVVQLTRPARPARSAWAPALAASGGRRVDPGTAPGRQRHREGAGRADWSRGGGRPRDRTSAGGFCYAGFEDPDGND